MVHKTINVQAKFTLFYVVHHGSFQCWVPCRKFSHSTKQQIWETSKNNCKQKTFICEGQSQYCWSNWLWTKDVGTKNFMQRWQSIFNGPQKYKNKKIKNINILFQYRSTYHGPFSFRHPRKTEYHLDAILKRFLHLRKNLKTCSAQTWFFF